MIIRTTARFKSWVDTIGLVDKQQDNYYFRLATRTTMRATAGSAASPAGMAQTTDLPARRIYDSSDWLFTATLIPSSGSLALAGLAG